ncbi:oligopeptide transporter 1-like [Macadamia integrifolia]|uniref:oligopeptide transporter 1-like n=1 Tax=Macadamia integrifolia TaxID=60698 RepID=UPI001C4F1554|nr:oligopeptide transporter 1-like [Macadamia integrifolia]
MASSTDENVIVAEDVIEAREVMSEIEEEHVNELDEGEVNRCDQPIEEEEVNDCPIEQVRLTVPITDDPTMPALTFRTWVLGVFSCTALTFANQFFSFRQNPIAIGTISAQLVMLPLGKLMAVMLPEKKVTLPITGWSFSLNPGPFNIKEHVLITTLASVGTGSVYTLQIITISKVFYKMEIQPLLAILLTLTTQMLGYSLAGVFKKYLVDSPYMWWPGSLIQVSMFRALHEMENRVKGRLTRFQFFFIALVSCFAYSIIPTYFFPSLSALSLICWIWPKSITAHQIGGGLHGLGLLSFGLDWNVVSSFLGSPLASPAYSIICSLVGAFLALYCAVPIIYWTNGFEAKRFPIFSSYTFDKSGNPYDVKRILDKKTFNFDQGAYNSYSEVYLSAIFVFAYGMSFATLAATVSHVTLFNGRSIWRQLKSSLQDKSGDVHNRIMKKYDTVPQWWFYTIFVVVLAFSIFACEGFGGKLQLPYWGVLLAITLGLVFTLPIGVIAATTNREPGLNVITELIIGYLYSGRPIANVVFKTYGHLSLNHSIYFLYDLKLGHYMKIPPKSMFLVQMVGTLINSMIGFGTAWWILTTVENICDVTKLPKGSPWTCPNENVFFSSSIINGVVGPLRMFGKLGMYAKLNWFFLVGLISPVPIWWLSGKFPQHKWIQLIHIPLIFSGATAFPVIKAVHFWTWGVVGIFFNVYVYQRYRGWWTRHTYVLSAALQAGAAFLSLLVYFSLQMNSRFGPDWWGADGGDHCPFATCPTDPGIVVDGCPSVS